MDNAEIINRLITLGKIPNADKLSDEMFAEYDELIGLFAVPLSFEEAEKLMTLFADECDDLNWGLLHLIENVTYTDIERYRRLISKCPNEEFKETFAIRFDNWLKTKNQ